MNWILEEEIYNSTKLSFGKLDAIVKKRVILPLKFNSDRATASLIRLEPFYYKLTSCGL